MDTIETLYKYFEKALLDHLRELGRGGQKRLAINAGISSALLNQIISSKNPKKASLKTQKALAKACGYIKYEDFLNYGKTLIQKQKLQIDKSTLSVKASAEPFITVHKDNNIINALELPYVKEIITMLVTMNESERQEIQKLSQEKIELKKLREIVQKNKL